MFSLHSLRLVRSGRTILSVDDLDIPTDKFTVILGHNGSGKSTLASILGGVVTPDEGTVQMTGEDWFSLNESDRARRAAFLPQKLPTSAGLTCRELVRLGRYPWRGLFGRWRNEDERAVTNALKLTGTERFAAAFADDLSGGERQRVWIAMLLAQASPVMILDEPTSALDVKHQYGVLALLKDLCDKEDRGVITIIHDVNLALRFATHVVALKAGRVLFEGSSALLHDEKNLEALFETRVRLLPHPEPELQREVAVVCR